MDATNAIGSVVVIGILLTAFIFFWREAKGSRRELKEDIQKETNSKTTYGNGLKR